jgi:predicted chitinase
MEVFSSGEVLLYLVPVCGICFGLVWSASEQQPQRQWLIILPLIFVLWLPGEEAIAQTQSAAQSASTSSPAVDSQFPTILKDGVTLPDWSKISFSSMPPFTEAGSIAIPSDISGSLGVSNISWNAGQKIADALPLGAMQGCLGFEALTQGKIDAITGQVSSGLGLDQFMPAGLQSVKSLADAVPGLSGQLVGSVKPISDLVLAGLTGQIPGLDLSSFSGLVDQATQPQQILDAAGGLLGSFSNGQLLAPSGNVAGSVNQNNQVIDSAGNIIGTLNTAGQFVNQAGQLLGTLSNPVGSVSQLATQAVAQTGVRGAGQLLNGLNIQQLTIGKLTEQFPQLAQLGLKNLNLSQYTMSQIPNLDLAKIGDFANWEQVLMKGIPGFDKIPFNKFPSPMQEGVDPFVARVDVPLDSEEQDRERSLSGSYKQGFRVACTENCEHAELSPIAGSQMDAASVGAFANGKSWMSKKQMVQGGEGILAAVNGGKEPTGRNPYCSMFKQVITTVDQPGGKVQTSMYFRICKHGIPDLGCTPYFIGPIPFLTYKEKQFIYLGAGNPKDDGSGVGFPGGNDPLSSTDGFEDNCSTKLSGEAVNKAVSAVDKVAAAMGSSDGAFSTSSANGAKHIPTIMAALKEEGITDPNQVAYALATVQRETSFVNFEEGGTRYESSGGSQYYGRGYVQLTHKENYIAATNYLKSKGVNVDLVANPELAKRPDIAAKVLAHGMKTGSLFGDGMTLDKCAGGGRVDWVKCRRMVNDGAQAQAIA